MLKSLLNDWRYIRSFASESNALKALSALPEEYHRHALMVRVPDEKARWTFVFLGKSIELDNLDVMLPARYGFKVVS